MSSDQVRVLVIDDEPHIRHFLRISLASQGFQVIEAATGREGLEKFSAGASAPNADIVLLDLGLPDMDGQQVLDAIRQHYEVPVIIVSVRGHEVRATAYLTRKGLFAHEAIPIDVLISPEQVVTDHVRRLIEHPGALQVLEFAGGLVQLVAVKAFYGGPLVGQDLAFLRRHMPNVDTRVSAIYRRNRPIIPRGDTVIEADDEVFFLAARRDIRTVMSELRRVERDFRRVVIAGGGNIGERLAEHLEHSHQVKIIEHNLERCTTLSERLDRTVVLHGSATSKRLLEEENIEECDIFCALTNDDEVNIMSSLLAKRLGAKKVLTLINNAAYVDLVQGGEIDIAISPQQATIGSLLTHVRRGDIVNVHSLRRGAAEAIEAIAHGDKQSSKVVGRTIREIDLPDGTTIGAIVRGKEVIIAHGDVKVESGDHVILFVVDKRRIRDVERLFQVGLSFF
ncbi:Trk system potassium transporter TrkA [Vreelandella indica]|uniref:Trk system potassium transporter TrkA n=1 Tax=Vreelandella indica TaxID=3126500 RepID=UPI00300DDA6C